MVESNHPIPYILNLPLMCCAAFNRFVRLTSSGFLAKKKRQRKAVRASGHIKKVVRSKIPIQNVS